MAKGGRENGALHVGILGNEAQALFQETKAALATAQYTLGEFIVTGLFGRPLRTGNHGANDLHNGNEQTAKGARSGMVPQDLPHGVKDGPGSHAPLFARKVVTGDGQSNRHVPNGPNVVGRPKETKQKVPTASVREIVEFKAADGHLYILVEIVVFHGNFGQTGQINGVKGPDNDKGNQSSGLNDGYQEEGKHVIDGFSGDFDTSNGHGDLFAQAAHDDKQECSQNPEYDTGNARGLK